MQQTSSTAFDLLRYLDPTGLEFYGFLVVVKTSLLEALWAKTLPSIVVGVDEAIAR